MRVGPPLGEELRAALGADHPELTGLASVSSAMHERILALWPGLNDLPVADADPRNLLPSRDR